MLLSADDVLGPKYLEKTRPYCEDYGIVSSGGFRTDETLVNMREYQYYFVQYLGIRELRPPRSFLHVLEGTCYLMSGTLWNREALVGLPVLPSEADLMPEWYYGIVLSQEMPMRFVWDPLFCYRLHSRNSAAVNVSGYLRGMRRLFGFLLERGLIRPEWCDVVRQREERVREETLQWEAELGSGSDGAGGRVGGEGGAKGLGKPGARTAIREAIKATVRLAMRETAGRAMQREMLEIVESVSGTRKGREPDGKAES